MTEMIEHQGVEPSLQLALEVHVSDLEKSLRWYGELGFDIVQRKETFVVLGWGAARFFLKEHPRYGSDAYANIRVLVDDVDAYWDLVQRLGVEVVTPIGNRPYGVRDFTVADPDGFGVRFATSLSDLPRN